MKSRYDRKPDKLSGHLGDTLGFLAKRHAHHINAYGLLRFACEVSIQYLLFTEDYSMNL